MIFERLSHLREIERLLRQFPVVGILGARQVGKTTLARQLARKRKGSTTVFDLESTEDLALLADPLLTLRPLRGLIVLDEIQRRPDFFAALRVLADEPQASSRRFLVLGSASPELVRQSSESLAGRVAYHEVPGFNLEEVGKPSLETLWRRGGFPRSFLARTEQESWRWRLEMIRSYLERDIPALGFRLSASALRRFWTMLAHYHGQTWNSSEFARSFGVAHTTIQHYLDVLTGTFMVRQLPSWHENIGKRQVKAPKIYIRDSGLLHVLLGLRTSREIASHPKVGASWEGFAIDTIVAHLGARPDECHFWATHGGAELDLLVVRGTKRIGFEFKRTTAPTLTRSMHAACEDLKLRRLYVIHGGARSFAMNANVEAIPLDKVLDELPPLK